MSLHAWGLEAVACGLRGLKLGNDGKLNMKEYNKIQDRTGQDRMRLNTMEIN